MECETNDCRKEKRGCKGCFYDEGIEITADEMFEKLGYKKSYTQLMNIRFYKDDDNVIYFKLDEKSLYKSGEYDGMHDSITMQELKAINKKVEELGWK